MIYRKTKLLSIKKIRSNIRYEGKIRFNIIYRRLAKKRHISIL